MRAPNGASRKRKTAANGRTLDRAKAKLAALSAKLVALSRDTSSIEQYIEVGPKTVLIKLRREAVLQALFPKRGPGRPRKEEYLDDGLPSWRHEDFATLEHGLRYWNRVRRQQGRTPDVERNQSLKEGYLAAKCRNVKMRDFAKQWFREQHGREATLDDVRTVERQIDRLLKKR